MKTSNTTEQASTDALRRREAALLYSGHFLPGVGRRNGSQRIGVIHAVEPLECNGDNFNSALCGKEPGRKSLGWHKSSSDITCAKCRKALGI